MKLTFIFIFLFTTNLFANDSEPTVTLRIFRHLDKSEEDPEEGPSADALTRMLALFLHMKDKSGGQTHTWDFYKIFSTNPYNDGNQTSEPVHSLRPDMTAAFVQSFIREIYGQETPITCEWTSGDPSDMSATLIEEVKHKLHLSSPTPSNPFEIAVIWDHHYINQLAARVMNINPATLPPWQSTDYDSVYEIKLNAQGQVKSFTIKRQEYPINPLPSGDKGFEYLANFFIQAGLIPKNAQNSQNPKESLRSFYNQRYIPLLHKHLDSIEQSGACFSSFIKTLGEEWDAFIYEFLTF